MPSKHTPKPNLTAEQIANLIVGKLRPRVRKPRLCRCGKLAYYKGLCFDHAKAKFAPEGE